MKLLKIDGYWIVVSDEKPNASDSYVDFLVFPSLIQYPLQHSGVEYKEDKVNGIYKNPIIQSVQGTTSTKNNCWKVIASQNSEHNLPTITFSDEVVKELGIVDSMILAREAAVMNNYDIGDDVFKHGFVVGYNQALSDNKDKRFTLEQIFSFIDDEDNHTEGELGNSCIDVSSFRNYIQSLTKQEWEVELEMEEKCNNCGDINCAHAICKSQIAKNKGVTLQPKITNNSVKVIKILK